MRILIVPDVPGWAIDHLAQAKIKYNEHHNFRCVYMHPRDAGSIEHQQRFKKEVDDFKPDVIHFEYFRSCSQILEAIPEIAKNYKIVLTHHNQKEKALKYANWEELGVDMLVTHTEKCKEILTKLCGQSPNKISVINHGIDLDYFEFKKEEPEIPIIGYVGRIVPWKGLREILWAAKELGYKVQVMGKHDKPDYWHKIVNEGLEDIIDFSFFDCSDTDRLKAYYNMTIYVGNSEDGLEEGTLPFLEAMACGTPVVTTPSGIAREIAVNENNCLLVPFEDKESLKNAISRLMSDKKLRDKLKENAWNTVKNMTEKKMAYDYSGLYFNVSSKNPLMSVIIPMTVSRLKQVSVIFKSLEKQTYDNFEVIIASDDAGGITEEFKEAIRETWDLTIKFIETKNSKYGLAMARNMAAVEAEGDKLVFIDSRVNPDINSLEMFNNILEISGDDMVWVFGNKAKAAKKSFVENFSAVSRNDFIKFGMFCERIDKYGGMSQEVRTRWSAQGGIFKYMDDITADIIINTSKDKKRRKEISDMKFLLHKMYKNCDL